MTTTALSIVDFNPPVLDKTLIEALKEEGINISDLKPERVLMPTGGILSFIFPPKADGTQDLRTSFNAVILFNHDCNAYWPDKKTKNTPPECSSYDGITGAYTDEHGEKCIRECASCPHNQYGTGTDQNGNPTKGKACKNMHRIYPLCEDEMIRPKLLNLPPTSLGTFAPDWKAKNIVLPRDGRTSYNTLIKVSLFDKMVGQNNVAITQFNVVGRVKPEVEGYLKEMQQEIKAKHKEVAFTGEDYNTDQGAGNTVDIDRMNFGSQPTGTDGKTEQLY